LLKLCLRRIACVYRRGVPGNEAFGAWFLTMSGVVRVAKGKLETVSLLLHGASLGSVAVCVALWIRAKTIGEDERGNAERRALFVGLWPPMLWLMGDTVSRQDARRSRRLRTSRTSRVRLAARSIKLS
jgi:hypothetical protein